jgi:hypothetical protein
MRVPLHLPAPQQGQALVEFVVAALFFIVPLFLALVAVGKFADVQHTAHMAARYGAWERTVWYEDDGSIFDKNNAPNHKTAGQIRGEIVARILNDRTSNTIIKNTDKTATTFVNGIDPMWRDNQGQRYLAEFSQTTANTANRAPSTNLADGAIGVISELPLPEGVAGTLAPPVPTSTLAVSTVKFNQVARDSQAYQHLWPKAAVWGTDWKGLDFSASGGILSNTWSANSSKGTHDMVADTVPTAKGLGTVVGKAAMGAMLTWDPWVAPGPDLGKIAVDVVPEDRLK